MPPLYFIKGWDKHFEISQSRKASRHYYVIIPNKQDGKGYRRIARQPDATDIFTAWVLILQVASKCPRRGVLMDEDGVITTEDLADKTLYPERIFERALTYLSSNKIGWIGVYDGGTVVVSESDSTTDREADPKVEDPNKATLSHASYFFSSKGMADFLRSCGLENEDALTRVYLTAGKKATLDELVQAIVEKKFFKKARSPVGMAIDAVRKGYHPSDESHAKMKELLSGTKRNQAAIPGTTRISPALRKAQEVFKANIPLMERNKIFAPSQLMNHPIYKTLIGEGNGNVWIAPNGERQTET